MAIPTRDSNRNNLPHLAIFFCIAQMFVSVPCFAFDFDDRDAPPEHPTICSDSGVHPYTPARSGGDSTTIASGAWAVLNSSFTDTLQFEDIAISVAADCAVCPGYARGVEHPPKAFF